MICSQVRVRFNVIVALCLHLGPQEWLASWARDEPSRNSSVEPNIVGTVTEDISFLVGEFGLIDFDGSNQEQQSITINNELEPHSCSGKGDFCLVRDR